jgi:hypothetical protein
MDPVNITDSATAVAFWQRRLMEAVRDGTPTPAEFDPVAFAEAELARSLANFGIAIAREAKP